MADRTVLVRLKANVSDFQAGMLSAGRSVSTLRKEIDTTNDRTAWLAQGLLSLGPATVPVAAAAVPALAGLTTQLGLTIAATGTAVMAFQGVGDALKALNDYQLEPTADNLEKMHDAMSKLGPDGAQFVRFLDEVAPKFAELQMAARAGMFPGMEKGITELVGMLPQIEGIVFQIGKALGALARESGQGLAGPGFEEFFEFLERQAKPMLVEFGQTLGNFIEGFAAMVVAFEPLSTTFSGGLLNMSEAFRDWAQGLDQSDSFADFLAYVQEAGPMVLDLFGSMVNLFVQLTQAAAPVGDVLVPALTALADVIAVLADTPLASVFIAAVAAMSAYGRLVALSTITTSGLGKAIAGAFKFGVITNAASAMMAFTTASDRAKMSTTQLAAAEQRRTTAMRSGVAQIGKVSGALAGLTLMSTETGQSMDASNTAVLGLMGTLGGPWGAALGAAVGLGMDLAATNDDVTESLDRMQAALDASDPKTANLEMLKDQLDEAESKVRDLADTLNDPSYTDIGDLMTGFKNTGEGIFGEDDYEEAFNRLQDLKQQYAELYEAAPDGAGQYMAAAEGIANAEREQAAATREAIAAMREKRQEALRGLNAELDYQQAIDDARKSMKENGKTVDETTEKGRNNLRTLYALAGAWNEQSDAAKNAKGSLRAARDNFIETAVAMDMPIGQAKRLADRLFEIPESRRTQIIVDAGGALSLLASIKARMDAIRSKTVWVNVKQSGGSRPMGGPIVDTGADGVTVQGPRYPYGDKMMYLLAPGEEVVSNRYGQADRHRDLLKAISANRLADGGTVGDPYYKMRDGGTAWASALGVEANYATMGLKALRRELKESEKALDKERTQRDAIRDKMAQIASGVSSGLRDDIFATQDTSGWSPWAQQQFGTNVATSANAALDADIAEGEEWIRLVETLSEKGLKDEALAELLSKNDIGLLRAYAALSAEELKAYSKKFKEREQILATAGVASGQATYGAQDSAAAAEVREARKELREIKQAIKDADRKNQDGHKGTGETFQASMSGAAGNARRKARRRTDG